MKTPDIHRPRLVCRAVRAWISVFGDMATAETGGLGAGHLASCEDCRSYFQACKDLEFSLKRSALHPEQAMPDGLEQRILRAVQQSKPEPKRSPMRHIPMLLAGVTACVALAVVLIQQRSEQQAVGKSEPLALSGDLVWSKLKPSASAVISGDPLQREVDAMVSDARSAVRFLERNFMPPASEDQSRKG